MVKLTTPLDLQKASNKQSWKAFLQETPPTFTFYNRSFDKSRLKTLIYWSVFQFGEKKTIDLVEKLKSLGFSYATQAGISLSIEDLKIPPFKKKIVGSAEEVLAFSEQQMKKGHLTSLEYFSKIIETWNKTSENLKDEVLKHFKTTDELNPVFLMAFSGARGNISQVRQLTSMRGLMANPQGIIIPFPIQSNFREGLTLTEYLISCHGARKGVVDTALRTATSGYLTRRLVDIAHHVRIRGFDCGTQKGVRVEDLKQGNRLLLALKTRLLGRRLAEDISLKSNQWIATRNQEVTLSLATLIAKHHQSVLVRSPLTCEKGSSVCQCCYGWSLATHRLVSISEAVGVIAAQSIGEPGTQLTMRTFHTGGVFSGEVSKEIHAPFHGTVSFPTSIPGKLVRTPYGQIAFLIKEKSFCSFKPFYDELGEPNQKESFNSIQNQENLTELRKTSYSPENSDEVSILLPAYTLLLAKQNQRLEKGQILGEVTNISLTSTQSTDSYQTVYSEFSGQFRLINRSKNLIQLDKKTLEFQFYFYQSVLTESAFSKLSFQKKLYFRKKVKNLKKLRMNLWNSTINGATNEFWVFSAQTQKMFKPTNFLVKPGDLIHPKACVSLTSSLPTARRSSRTLCNKPSNGKALSNVLVTFFYDFGSEASKNQELGLLEAQGFSNCTLSTEHFSFRKGQAFLIAKKSRRQSKFSFNSTFNSPVFQKHSFENHGFWTSLKVFTKVQTFQGLLSPTENQTLTTHNENPQAQKPLTLVQSQEPKTLSQKQIGFSSLTTSSSGGLLLHETCWATFDSQPWTFSERLYRSGFLKFSSLEIALVRRNSTRLSFNSAFQKESLVDSFCPPFLPNFLSGVSSFRSNERQRRKRSPFLEAFFQGEYDVSKPSFKLEYLQWNPLKLTKSTRSYFLEPKLLPPVQPRQSFCKVFAAKAWFKKTLRPPLQSSNSKLTFWKPSFWIFTHKFQKNQRVFSPSWVLTPRGLRKPWFSELLMNVDSPVVKNTSLWQQSSGQLKAGLPKVFFEKVNPVKITRTRFLGFCTKFEKPALTQTSYSPGENGAKTLKRPFSQQLFSKSFSLLDSWLWLPKIFKLRLSQPSVFKRPIHLKNLVKPFQILDSNVFQRSTQISNKRKTSYSRFQKKRKFSYTPTFSVEPTRQSQAFDQLVNSCSTSELRQLLVDYQLFRNTKKRAAFRVFGTNTTSTGLMVGLSFQGLTNSAAFWNSFFLKRPIHLFENFSKNFLNVLFTSFERSNFTVKKVLEEPKSRDRKTLSTVLSSENSAVFSQFHYQSSNHNLLQWTKNVSFGKLQPTRFPFLLPCPSILQIKESSRENLGVKTNGFWKTKPLEMLNSTNLFLKGSLEKRWEFGLLRGPQSKALPTVFSFSSPAKLSRNYYQSLSLSPFASQFQNRFLKNCFNEKSYSPSQTSSGPQKTLKNLVFQGFGFTKKLLETQKLQFFLVKSLVTIPLKKMSYSPFPIFQKPFSNVLFPFEGRIEEFRISNSTLNEVWKRKSQTRQKLLLNSLCQSLGPKTVQKVFSHSFKPFFSEKQANFQFLNFFTSASLPKRSNSSFRGLIYGQKSLWNTVKFKVSTITQDQKKLQPIPNRNRDQSDFLNHVTKVSKRPDGQFDQPSFYFKTLSTLLEFEKREFRIHRLNFRFQTSYSSQRLKKVNRTFSSTTVVSPKTGWVCATVQVSPVLVKYRCVTGPGNFLFPNVLFSNYSVFSDLVTRRFTKTTWTIQDSFPFWFKTIQSFGVGCFQTSCLPLAFPSNFSGVSNSKFLGFSNRGGLTNGRQRNTLIVKQGLAFQPFSFLLNQSFPYLGSNQKLRVAFNTSVGCFGCFSDSNAANCSQSQFSKRWYLFKNIWLYKAPTTSTDLVRVFVKPMAASLSKVPLNWQGQKLFIIHPFLSWRDPLQFTWDHHSFDLAGVKKGVEVTNQKLLLFSKKSQVQILKHVLLSFSKSFLLVAPSGKKGRFKPWSPKTTKKVSRTNGFWGTQVLGNSNRFNSKASQSASPFLYRQSNYKGVLTHPEEVSKKAFNFYDSIHDYESFQSCKRKLNQLTLQEYCRRFQFQSRKGFPEFCHVLNYPTGLNTKASFYVETLKAPFTPVFDLLRCPRLPLINDALNFNLTARFKPKLFLVAPNKFQKSLLPRFKNLQKTQKNCFLSKPLSGLTKAKKSKGFEMFDSADAVRFGFHTSSTEMLCFIQKATSTSLETSKNSQNQSLAILDKLRLCKQRGFKPGSTNVTNHLRNHYLVSKNHQNQTDLYYDVSSSGQKTGIGRLKQLKNQKSSSLNFLEVPMQPTLQFSWSLFHPAFSKEMSYSSFGSVKFKVLQNSNYPLATSDVKTLSFTAKSGLTLGFKLKLDERQILSTSFFKPFENQLVKNSLENPKFSKSQESLKLFSEKSFLSATTRRNPSGNLHLTKAKPPKNLKSRFFLPGFERTSNHSKNLNKPKPFSGLTIQIQGCSGWVYVPMARRTPKTFQVLHNGGFRFSKLNFIQIHVAIPTFSKNLYQFKPLDETRFQKFLKTTSLQNLENLKVLERFTVTSSAKSMVNRESRELVSPFLSPGLSSWKGEVLSIQNSLPFPFDDFSVCPTRHPELQLLTDLDLITFRLNVLFPFENVLKKTASNVLFPFQNPRWENFKKEPLHIGQVLRYGHKISKGVGVNESGQILSLQSTKLVLRYAKPFLLPRGARYNLVPGEFVQSQSPLFTLKYKSLKTEDIVQGIPKIEQIFEARESMQDTLGIKTLLKQKYFFYKTSESQAVAVRKSFTFIQTYIVNQIQTVYQSQGVNISDKHIEIIVKQMTSKVKISNPFQSGFLKGDLISLDGVEKLNFEIQKLNADAGLSSFTTKSLHTSTNGFSISYRWMSKKRLFIQKIQPYFHLVDSLSKEIDHLNAELSSLQNPVEEARSWGDRFQKTLPKLLKQNQLRYWHLQDLKETLLELETTDRQLHQLQAEKVEAESVSLERTFRKQLQILNRELKKVTRKLVLIGKIDKLEKNLRALKNEHQDVELTKTGDQTSYFPYESPFFKLIESQTLELKTLNKKLDPARIKKTFQRPKNDLTILYQTFQSHYAKLELERQELKRQQEKELSYQSKVKSLAKARKNCLKTVEKKQKRAQFREWEVSLVESQLQSLQLEAANYESERVELSQRYHSFIANQLPQNLFRQDLIRAARRPLKPRLKKLRPGLRGLLRERKYEEILGNFLMFTPPSQTALPVPFRMELEYEPVVLGITKASLEKEGFLSAASFQETIQILTRASLFQRGDFLKGLKENVIVGHLIPAGTGSVQNLALSNCDPFPSKLE